MQQSVILALLGAAAFSKACVIPATPPPTTIMDPFGLLIENPAFPIINNRYMNFFPAGGGDQHLFLAPTGDPTFNLVLVDGVITRGILHAVIGGEYSPAANTTKIFVTERNDPRAVFTPTYRCNPVTDALETLLVFSIYATTPPVYGGNLCVREASGNRHEFRYSPPDNPKKGIDCMEVTMIIARPGGSQPTTLTTLTTTTPTTTTAPPVDPTTTTAPPVDPTTTTTTTAAATTSTPPPNNSPPPYVDLTSSGFRFLGCAPEERRVVPADGAFRTLNGFSNSIDTQTNPACAALCKSKGYKYAGTEWSRECWCGNTVASTRVPKTTLASLAACNFKCTGAPTTNCGGDAWLSLYEQCPVGGPCENVVFT